MALRLRPLADQVVVVTGASSGIGLVTARMAAARGARVLLVARNEAALARAVAGIAADGGEAAFHVADVGDYGQLLAAAAAAVARFGRIDSWVSNAGVAIYAPLLDTPVAEHRRLFDTNYFGVVHGAMAAVPHLRERGGALVTVASVVAEIPSPTMGAYAASKHAVKAYVEALRIELRSEGAPVSVTLVEPSGVDTPVARNAADHLGAKARIPPPAYAPELVAAAILHATEHPRRTLVVGGAGRAQVALARTFPALFERLAPLIALLVVDRSRPADPGSNLSTPGGGGERSGDEAPRETSLYAATQVHPVAAAAIAGVGIAAAVVLAWRATRLRDSALDQSLTARP